MCALKRAEERVVDLILLSTYEDHDVDEEPILFPRCGHFFSVESLDELLNMKEVFNFYLVLSE
jgi:hypothetical protein